MAVGDSDAAIRQFMTGSGYTYPLMVDTGSVGSDYDISVIPTLVLIDGKGKIVKTISGVVSAAELGDLVNDLLGR